MWAVPMFLLTSQRRKVPSGERCAFAIPNPPLLLMLCNSQSNYCSICTSPARPLQAVLKAPPSPASAIHTPALLQTLLIRNTTHRCKVPLTAIHHSLKPSKCVCERKDMREKGVKAGSEKVCKGGDPWSCRRTRSCWLMKALAVMASKCDNSGTLKGVNSSASPASVQLGTKWSLSHCILLRRSLRFRICSIIFSSWAKADRHVGRCVLSIPFTPWLLKD